MLNLLNWRKPIESMGNTRGMVLENTILYTLKAAKSILTDGDVDTAFEKTVQSFPTEQEKAAYQQGIQDCHAYHLKNLDEFILGYSNGIL
jgi:hypothetical protein